MQYNFKYFITMKKILIGLVAVLALTTANAQEKKESNGFKGAWWALGQLNYTDTEATDTSAFTFLPVVGTFVSPTVTVGLGLGYTSTKVGNADAVDAFVVAPVARKYWSINDKFFIFGQADVPLTFYDGATGYGFNLRPGVDFFVSNKLTFEATFGQFGYNAVKPENGDAVGTTTLGFNSGGAGLLGGLQFGIKYLF